MPDYGRDEVADHTLALALSVLRGVVVLDRSVHDGVWDLEAARPLRRLSTLTYGVVGCGAIGAAVARRAAGLGMRVLGHDVPQVRSNPPIERVPLEELLLCGFGEGRQQGGGCRRVGRLAVGRGVDVPLRVG